jgi:hypothetical protein
MAVAALWVAAGPAAGASSDPRAAIREQSEKTFEARGLRSLQVTNARGLISVRPASDGRIRLVALKIVRGGDNRQTRELAASTSVETRIAGDRCLVEVRYPTGRQLKVGFFELLAGVEFPRVEVRLALDVPPDLELDLKSTSGDVTTDEMRGAQVLKSTSGDIGIGSALGPLHATTTSGEIEIDRLARAELASVSGDVLVGRAAGPVDVATTSGEITVEEAADSVRASSVSGDVRIARARRGAEVRTTSGSIEVRAAGRIDVRTVSGDLVAAADAPFGGAEIETQSGDLTVKLGAGVGCALEVSTASGSIDIALPLSMETVSRRHVAGRVPGGAARCVVRSSSGDIVVER